MNFGITDSYSGKAKAFIGRNWLLMKQVWFWIMSSRDLKLEIEQLCSVQYPLFEIGMKYRFKTPVTNIDVMITLYFFMF